MYAAPYLILFRIHRAAIEARRKSRTWHYLAWSVLAGLLSGAMLAFGISMFTVFWIIGLWWIAIPLGVVMVIPVLLPLVVRHVVVPLGWTRIAYWAGRFSRPGPDAPAYGACCAAWAFSFDPAPAGETWLAQRREARIPLGDAEVVVTALVAAGRGDAETCRQLLRSVAMLVEDHPAVREIAGEWLAVDAASRAVDDDDTRGSVTRGRGAWRELHATADTMRWPSTPLTFLLEGIAARQLGAAGAPGKLELASRWLLAPHRRATKALIDAQPPPVSAPSPETADTTELTPATDIAVPPSPLPRAVATYLAFGHHDPTPAGLAATVRAWDSALADGATHSWLARRALELDAPLGAVDRALREVAGTVTEELARAADRARRGFSSAEQL